MYGDDDDVMLKNKEEYFFFTILALLNAIFIVFYFITDTLHEKMSFWVFARSFFSNIFSYKNKEKKLQRK